MHDLVLTNARILDPAEAVDHVADIAFADGRVAGIGHGLAGAERRDCTGLVVTPGLIDLHSHVYWGGTALGIDALDYARRSGVTTCIDTGSAGPGNFAGFRAHVIEPSPVRILAYLHISFAGIYGFGREVHLGESADIRLMAPRSAARVAGENPGVVIGIKVRLGRHASGDQGLAPLDYALEVAEEAGLPVMAHIDEPPPSYEALCEQLRPGDVLTHCFRPAPNSPVGPNGRVREAVRRARGRGVLFDVGHGMGSFAYRTARAMLAAGFPPDTISSDVHALCIDGPAYDLATTLSKFFCLGMTLTDVIRAATEAPARAIGRAELGTLRAGTPGDATLLAIEEGRFDYEDVTGEILAGDTRIVSRGAVIGGRMLEPAGA